MASEKWSVYAAALSSGSAPATADIVVGLQGGVPVQFTLAQIATEVLGGTAFAGFAYTNSTGKLALSGIAAGATTVLLINPASASGLLADFQVGGTSRANIDAVTGAYAISSDTFINRDAAGIFGLSNGAKDTGTVTLPASERIYNTANGGLSGGNVVNAALMEMGFSQHSGIAAIDVYKNGTGTLPNFGIYIGGTKMLDYGISNGGAASFNTSLYFLPGTGGINASGNNIVTGGAGVIGWVGGSLLTSPAAAQFQFGQANVNGAPVAQTISFQGALAASATDQASATTTIIGSLGTGAGTNGDIVFKTGVKTSTGTAQAAATEVLRVLGENGGIKFSGSGSFTANGAVATVLGSAGPTGANTTVQKWLTIVDNGGTTRYIPCF